MGGLARADGALLAFLLLGLLGDLSYLVIRSESLEVVVFVDVVYRGDELLRQLRFCDGSAKKKKKATGSWATRGDKPDQQRLAAA
jgi:hypothetical protein